MAWHPFRRIPLAPRFEGQAASAAGLMLPDDLPYRAADTGGAPRIGSGSVATATRGSHSSQLGRYQFQSPSSFMLAGSKTARMIVASIKTAAAKPDAELLQQVERQGDEDREDEHHHDRGARHDAGCGLDPVLDRLVRRHALIDALADAADDEDVVVHRQSEQDHEQEHRHERLDPSRRGADQSAPDAVLEDEHEDAVGGSDRERVEHDRLHARSRSSGRRAASARRSARTRRRTQTASSV